MQRSEALRRLLLAATVLVLCGCSSDDAASTPTGTVQGKVTLDGKPVTDAAIVFFAESAGVTASAVLDAEGKYTLKYGDSFSVPVGDYRVSFGTANQSEEAPDPQALMENPEQFEVKAPPVPEKYRTAESSGLIAVVKEGSNPDVNFDLESN
jgi:hypothetical protein